MKILTKYKEIDKAQWAQLVRDSKTATWFQTAEAYEFYASLPELFIPFAVAVENKHLRGAIVGYVTKEKNALKQFATRRAIIIGGPLLAEDVTEAELKSLLQATTDLLSKDAIYIETRNFHDYSNWRPVFEQCGWKYEEHLNFQVECLSEEQMMGNMDRCRRRNINSSIKEGCVMIEQPTIEQIREWYILQEELYRTKVKTPLFPISFFEKLYHHPNGRFFLVEYNGKIVGGTACVVLKNNAVYEWFGCGVDGIIKGVYPSSLSTYQGMLYAKNNGIPILDMMGAGTPKDDYGVRKFKERFGGKLVSDGRFIYVCKPMLYAIGKVGVKILKKL